MESKIGQFEFVDCSSAESEFLPVDNNSSSLHNEEQAIGRSYMSVSSNVSTEELVPFIKTEPSQWPKVKTEPSDEHPVVKYELIEEPQLVVEEVTIEDPQPVVRNELIHDPANGYQVYAVPLSDTFVGKLEALQMIRKKRRSVTNNQQGIVIGDILGNIRRGCWKTQGTQTPIRPKRKSVVDCRNLLKEQYILCKKLVLEDAHASKSSESNSSLSSQTSISEFSSDCESESKYRNKKSGCKSHSKYRSARDRNNLASRRSRQKRKDAIQRLQLELAELNKKNLNLCMEYNRVVKFEKEIKELILRCEQIGESKAREQGKHRFN